MIGVSMENSGRVPDHRNLTDRERVLLERLIQHGTPASKANISELEIYVIDGDGVFALS